MKENDYAFINQVVDFYYSTIDEGHPQGNMSTVAEEFKITRAKVNKILITARVIDSPLYQDIIKLKERGYDTDDIASALGVSAATVKINMPYEKVIYNGDEMSAGASYVEEFRKREKVFLKKVVRKKTNLEREREAYWGNPENVYIHDYMKAQGFFDNLEPKDDPIHLSPNFTEEESKLFKISIDMTVLHIELDADLSEVKDLAEIKYESMLYPLQSSLDGTAGQERVDEIADNHKVYTISRDILIPSNIPLHNLHYMINRAFGFTNSHLHEYTLSDHDLKWVTEGKISKWKKYVGLLFKNPVRDENIDFWDDDYEGGSPKKWMRSKYTGPVYDKIFEESYPYAQEEMSDVEITSKNIDGLKREFYLNPLALNEALPVDQVLSHNGQEEYKNIDEYNVYMDECFEDAAEYPEETQMSQTFLYSFAKILNYRYDFGDGWSFTIKPFKTVEYLIKDGRITVDKIREAIKDVCTLARPVVIAADGLPLVEDVGGEYGYMEFLKGIHGLGNGVYANKKESLQWAKGNGWSGKIGNLKTLL